MPTQTLSPRPGLALSGAGLLLALTLATGAPEPLAAASIPAPTTVATDSSLAPVSALPFTPFALRANGIESDLELVSHFVAPSATVEVEVALAAGEPSGRFLARADGGQLDQLAPGRWRWTAPAAPGRADVVVEDASGGAQRTLRLFVLTPYDGGASLGGYAIGAYPADKKGRTVYERPRGFVAVSDNDLELAISPHFRLGQFLCKQGAGAGRGQATGVRYVVLRTELLLALERLLEATNEAGIEADTFTVMSGYRTPSYNAAIGNETSYSRHTYGDAADVFIDRDGDGRMDDLDGNGNVDAADARVLYSLAERLAGREIPAGGLGLYGPKPHRGPFLHLDTRGSAARWAS